MNTLKLLRIFALAVGAGCAASESIRADELVFNGGFEVLNGAGEGTFSGWTQTGSVNLVGVVSSFAKSGHFGAYFGPVYQQSGIEQNITTVAGATYDLNFWLSAIGPMPDLPFPDLAQNHWNNFSVKWDGTTLMSLVDSPPFAYGSIDVSPNGYVSFIGVLATTTSTSLEFSFRHDPGFWGIDDISVVLNTLPPDPNPNPDPVPDSGSTFGFMALALACLAAIRRKQRV